MSGDEVRALLGNPLRISPTKEAGEEIWSYANPKVWDGSGLGANCWYSERDIFLANGIVRRRYHGFYFD
jgi:hypothetical protein